MFDRHDPSGRGSFIPRIAITFGRNGMVARVAERDLNEELFRTELAELRRSNHQLRAKNLALRSRIERQKSHRVLERSLIIGGMVALWFFFILSVMTKLIALSN